jgi:hypothetical protein
LNTQTTFATQSRHVVRRAAEADVRCGRICSALLASVGFAAFLLVSAPALAATALNLNTATTFGIVAGSTFTNTAAGTTVNGDICYTTLPLVAATSPNPPVVPCTPQIKLTDLPNALADLNAQALAATCTPIGAAVDLSLIAIGGGTPGVFPPGCYKSTGAMSVGSAITLSGNGVYIFKPNGALNTANGSIVNLAGACAGNVFWGPTATTLGANSIFVGSVLDDTSVITLGHLATWTGRALAFGVGGTVTTDANTITVPAACLAPPPTVTVTKVSNGGVGPFSFTGNNGFAPQTITTVTSGTGVAGATQTLTAAGVITAITESAPPAGFVLASITCTGLGAGGTATPVIATGTVTLDAAATATGAAIACTFTNTFAGSQAPIPTLSEWAMILLAALLSIAGFAAMRRRAR